MTGAGFGGVDTDLLADYIGGALAGTPDETVVADLVSADPAWRAAYDELAGAMAAVGAELGRLGPEPMPAELAERLDTMLATPIAAPAVVPGEQAPRLAIVDGAGASAGAANPVPVKNVGARRRGTGAHPGRRLRWATPIAIAAGVVAFVGFGLDYLSGRGSGSADSSYNSTAGGAADSAKAPAAHPVETLASGTDYTVATLAGGPARTMITPRLRASAGQMESNQAAGSEPALGRLTEPPALDACLTAVERENAGGAISVESVDYARFAGLPALVIRFSAANGYWAWASGADCGTPAAGADTLGKVPVR